MSKLLVLVMVTVLPLTACTPPVDDQCACERAQGDCGTASEDIGLGLPDYPGC